MVNQVFASIVLYYHQYDDIQKTLNSLLSSKYISKIILVNNGGANWVNELNNEKVIYIESPKNGGFGYGHNLAMHQYAKDSEFFLICNPDIYFDSEQLNAFIEIAKSREEGLFSPTILYPNGDNQYGQRLLPTPLNLFARRFLKSYADKLDESYLLKNRVFNEPSFVPVCSGCFMLFRSQALLALNGFDDRYFMYMEDVDLSRRCAVKYGNCFVPNIYIYHEHGQGSYYNKKLLKYHLISAIYYFNKWGWIFDRGRKVINKNIGK